jgi:DNA-directed RNA polymerase specialized sigma24 family protein
MIEETEEQSVDLSAADDADRLDRLYRELERQDVLKEAAQWAKRFVPILRRHGIACSSRMHEELVQDAVCDFIEGRRRWDSEVPFPVALRNVMRSRVSNAVKHAKKYQHDAIEAETMLDESNDGEEVKEAKVVKNAEPRCPAAGRALSLKDACRRLLVAIRTAAPLDLPIRRVLEAWERGHVDRQDAIAASGLAAPHYDAACKRIKVIALGLPEELVDGTVDALEVSYVG